MALQRHKKLYHYSTSVLFLSANNSVVRMTLMQRHQTSLLLYVVNKTITIPSLLLKNATVLTNSTSIGYTLCCAIEWTTHFKMLGSKENIYNFFSSIKSTIHSFKHSYITLIINLQNRTPAEPTPYCWRKSWWKCLNASKPIYCKKLLCYLCIVYSVVGTQRCHIFPYELKITEQ